MSDDSINLSDDELDRVAELSSAANLKRGNFLATTSKENHANITQKGHMLD